MKDHITQYLSHKICPICNKEVAVTHTDIPAPCLVAKCRQCGFTLDSRKNKLGYQKTLEAWNRLRPSPTTDKPNPDECDKPYEGSRYWAWDMLDQGYFVRHIDMKGRSHYQMWSGYAWLHNDENSDYQLQKTQAAWLEMPEQGWERFFPDQFKLEASMTGVYRPLTGSNDTFLLWIYENEAVVIHEKAAEIQSKEFVRIKKAMEDYHIHKANAEVEQPDNAHEQGSPDITDSIIDREMYWMEQLDQTIPGRYCNSEIVEETEQYYLVKFKYGYYFKGIDYEQSEYLYKDILIFGSEPPDCYDDARTIEGLADNGIDNVVSDVCRLCRWNRACEVIPGSEACYAHLNQLKY